MTFLQWRRFHFFEKEISKSNDDLNELVKSCQITCSSSGSGYLILGDNFGLINIVSRQHKVTSFSAYKISVTHCKSFSAYQAPTVAGSSSQSSKFYIVTIGTDAENLEPILKIWRINELNFNTPAARPFNEADSLSESLQNISDNNQTASCIRSLKLCSTVPQLQSLHSYAIVTALDVFEDSAIAVGFSDGHCLFIKGELTRDRNLKMNLLLVSSNNIPITGLAFSFYTKSQNKQQTKGFRNSDQLAKRQIILFVATRNEVCSFDLSTRNAENKILLDSFGCEVSCSCLKQDPSQLESIQFVIGRNNAIYFYNLDGRGPCLAYDGQKMYLYWFRNYLVVITANQQNESPSTGTKLPNSNPNLITIYDINKKFIAFSSPIPGTSQVMSEWGLLYILTLDGRLITFTECDTQTKLELLFRKNQFSLAIDLAKAQSYSHDSLANMFKQYGDHLYQNGDYDGAITQYCKTLGFLEPSYVIRKYLDLQKIKNLTQYLQELHLCNLATEDHTTLLINCYVKQKNEQTLNEFLRSSDIVFDVDIAIRVLRQAGYYDNAVLLAKRHDRYDPYFSILLEDKSDSSSVLGTFYEFLKDHKADVVCQFLSKYGRLLMADEPNQTTELLKSLCSLLMKQQNKPAGSRKSSQDETEKKSSDLQIDLADLASVLNEVDKDFKPEGFIHIFMNHPLKLIEFLEFIITESKSIIGSDGQSLEVPFEISNTLLEMYLYSYKNEIKEDGLAGNETKIMNFLKEDGANYDFKKAMILCQMSNFMPGVIYLYEKARMFKQILAHYIAKNDSANVIETCQRYGDEERNLWIEALWYFSEHYCEQHHQSTIMVLEQIEQHKLLPPMMVVEVLSKHAKVTLGVVRDFLMRWIRTEQDQIDENEQLIKSYQEECDRIQGHIEEITQKPRVFQAAKCSACNHSLELPSVHFMCGHSYHQTCFESYIAENDHDCPLCLPENRKVLNEISSLENVNNVNELFQQELATNTDPFDVISRYCSQGLFNPLTVLTDDGLIQSRSTKNYK